MYVHVAIDVHDGSKLYQHKTYFGVNIVKHWIQHLAVTAALRCSTKSIFKLKICSTSLVLLEDNKECSSTVCLTFNIYMN